MAKTKKKSIRAWVVDEYNIEQKDHYLIRKAARVVKKLNIGEPHPGCIGILLTPSEWKKVKGEL